MARAALSETTPAHDSAAETARTGNAMTNNMSCAAGQATPDLRKRGVGQNPAVKVTAVQPME